jgi:hypothetical protein
MRSGRRDGSLGVVSVQEPVRVVLEIRRTRRTISRELAVDGAPARGFYGWLELIDDLERASGPQSPDAGSCPEPNQKDDEAPEAWAAWQRA